MFPLARSLAGLSMTGWARCRTQSRSNNGRLFCCRCTTGICSRYCVQPQDPATILRRTGSIITFEIRMRRILTEARGEVDIICTYKDGASDRTRRSLVPPTDLIDCPPGQVTNGFPRNPVDKNASTMDGLTLTRLAATFSPVIRYESGPNPSLSPRTR